MIKYFDLLQKYSEKYENDKDIMSLCSELGKEETIKALEKSKGRKIEIYYEENTMDGVKYKYE